MMGKQKRSYVLQKALRDSLMLLLVEAFTWTNGHLLVQKTAIRDTL